MKECIIFFKEKLKKNTQFYNFYSYFRDKLRYFNQIYTYKKNRKNAIRTSIQAKEKAQPIKVAFLMYELPFWKNESLYKAMNENPMFEPAIWITDNPIIKNVKIQMEVKSECLRYVQVNSFRHFIDLSLEQLRTAFSPDYIFVVHPYHDHIPFEVSDLKKELACYIQYSYINLSNGRAYDSSKLQYFYRFYVESDYIHKEAKKYMFNRAQNVKATGLPMSELLLTQAQSSKSQPRKNIVWAPHWSIRNHTGGLFNVSTFLSFYETMLSLAEKYSDSINLIFKPHPLLKRYLYNDPEWGQEKTDKYYHDWEIGSNTALNEGDYKQLFSCSDALIHDSGSFIHEYLLMDKPCLYLVRNEGTLNYNESTQKALECYIKGYSDTDIEKFIQSVIKGVDNHKEIRNQFVHSYLFPAGFSPVNNIIQDILNP